MQATKTTVQTRSSSPFVKFVTYSVLDGARLVLAHDHRHLQQAGRVVQSPGFL